MLEIKKKLTECPCIGKRLKYPRISRKIMKILSVWLTRGYCWRQRNFPVRFPANEWSILIDLR